MREILSFAKNWWCGALHYADVAMAYGACRKYFSHY